MYDIGWEFAFFLIVVVVFEMCFDDMVEEFSVVVEIAEEFGNYYENYAYDGNAN